MKMDDMPRESIKGNQHYSADDLIEAEYIAWQCTRNMVLCNTMMHGGEKPEAKHHLHLAGLAFAKFCSLVDPTFLSAFEMMKASFDAAENHGDSHTE